MCKSVDLFKIEWNHRMHFIVIVFSFSLKKSIVVVRDMYRLSVSCFGYDCTQSIKFKPIKIISPFVKLTCFVLSCRRLPFKIMNCCMSFENHTTLLFHDLHLGILSKSKPCKYYYIDSFRKLCVSMSGLTWNLQFIHFKLP